MRVPWLRSVTLAVAGTKYNLFTLLKAVDSTLPRHCQACQIQVDVNAGGARVYISNPEATTPSTDNGAELVSSQAYSIPSLSSNLIVLDDIIVATNTNATRLNVTIVGR